MLEADADTFVPNFNYRYLREDMPFGLAITKAITQLAQVDTPGIDTVIRWAENKLGKRYLINRKLYGPDASAVPIPQPYSVNTLAPNRLVRP